MNKNQKNAVKIYSVVSSFLFEIVITVGVSFAIGYFLDEWLHTVVLFKILFIVIGVFAGLRNLIVRISKVEEPKDDEKR